MTVELIASTPDPERLIERCARISHGSKVSDTIEDTRLFIMEKLVGRHEESPLEHASATFFISGISRVCSHQIVRHRLASYTQQSGRYTRISTSAVENAPTIVMPVAFHDVDKDVEQLRTDTEENPSLFRKFRNALDACVNVYEDMLASGIPNEDARFILPQGMSTSLYMTANFREWRHFLKLRTDIHAQWEVREVANSILSCFRDMAPSCVYDILPVIDDNDRK